MNMNKSIVKKDNNTKSNLHLEVHQYKNKRSEDIFDWNWIFEKGWLRIKK